MDKYIESSLKSIGSTIKASRKHVGLTQKELADQLGVSVGSVSRYEHGLVDIPVSILLKINRICGLQTRLFFPLEQEDVKALLRMLEQCVSEEEPARKPYEYSMPWVSDKPILGEASASKQIPDTPLQLSLGSIELIHAYQILLKDYCMDDGPLMEMREQIIVHIEKEVGYGREVIRKQLLQRAYF
ncbi:MAG: helix-turn-helix domain-containing protein [Lachnospiraceae bacterium]|nr:helix-turn-helix domain-containing protein [Lachnospiraceae bacterium]